SAREFGKRFRGQALHVSTRNFPADTAAILKQYHISEGGNAYAFFTTAEKNKRIVLICEKAI
ncbi:MAG TPA: hypothetical protein VD772_06030, partial [Anseongella sp.]|nr:hypothetical protein [Anseongella sp.]